MIDMRSLIFGPASARGVVSRGFGAFAYMTLVLLSTASAAETTQRQAVPTSPRSSSGAQPGDTQLEEIVVFARRRDERLEDTPVAVSVRTGIQLQEQSARRFDDIGRDVPNVRTFSSPQSTNALDVTIRGQTVVRSAIEYDPAVGLYVDGVYSANGQGALATLLDVGSVEVVRGAQGTLFGRNNTGGSISFWTNRPELDAYRAEVSGSAGTYSAWMGRAIVNVPVTDEFGLRLAYQIDQRDGWGSSVGSGQDNFANQHRYQLRVGALWKPTDATDAYLTYERFDANEVGAILHPLTGPPPGTLVSQIGQLFAQFPIPGLPTVTFPRNYYKTDAGYHAFDQATNDAVHLTVKQQLNPDLEAKLIVGYQHVDASTALDVDASTLPLADATLNNTSNETTAEFQLSGKSFAQKLDWVGGLYWFLDHGGAPSVQAPASPEFLAALQALNEATGGQVDLSPYFSPVPVYEQNSARNESEAAFLHAEYHLTDDWAVAAGARYTSDTREIDENSYVEVPVYGRQCTILDLSLPPPYRIQGPCPPIHKSVDYGYWSWEFSARYRINDELNSYLRIGRSQRSGGWNAPLTSIQDAPFRPEELTDYEVGLKSDLLGGSLRLNLAAFYGNYDNIQRLLAMLTPSGTPTTIVINAGSATVSGVEVESVWRVLNGLSLLGSFGWTDARYDTFEYQPIPGGPSVDLSNNEFYQTPRYQASAAIAYEVPISVGMFKLYADYAWQDKIQFNVINDFNYQKAYGTVNARAAIDSRSREWEIALFGNNLTDTHFAYSGGTFAVPLSPVPTMAWQASGARRVVGLEATYRWGAVH